MNNPIVHSVISTSFSDSFGFTKYEINNMLQYYNLENHKDEIKNWYDGYIFGKKEIYNPWSTTNHIWNLLNDENSPCCPYWSTTSSNDIIRHIIQNANFNTKAIIEDLMNGIPYENTLYEDITYAQLDARIIMYGAFCYSQVTWKPHEQVMTEGDATISWKFLISK